MNIREKNKILKSHEESPELLVFTSINQAKLYNRTLMGGSAVRGTIPKGKYTVTQIKHVAK